MKKYSKKIRALIYLIATLTIFFVSSMISELGFLTQRVENVDGRTTREITRVINRMLRVYYGRFDERRLEGILSEELIQRVLEEDEFKTFREERNFFFRDHRFMGSLRNHGFAETGEEFFVLRVDILEGLLMSWNTFHNLVIERQLDGTMLITSITYDR